VTIPTRRDLAGMTGNERLFATGMEDRFRAAAACGDLDEMREILEALDFDALSVARILRDAEAARIA
jgi:hypothetical protein